MSKSGLNRKRWIVVFGLAVSGALLLIIDLTLKNQTSNGVFNTPIVPPSINVSLWPPALPGYEPVATGEKTNTKSLHEKSAYEIAVAKFEKAFLKSENYAAYIQLALGDPTGAGLSYAVLANASCLRLHGLQNQQFDTPKNSDKKIIAAQALLEKIKPRCDGISVARGEDFRNEVRIRAAAARTSNTTTIELHNTVRTLASEIDFANQLHKLRTGRHHLIIISELELYGTDIFTFFNKDLQLSESDRDTVFSASLVVGCELFAGFCNDHLTAVENCLSNLPCPSLNLRDHYLERVAPDKRALFVRALGYFREIVGL